MCRRFGVLTPEDEFPVWDGPGGPVTVAPLFTLYDYSFLDGADGPDGLPDGRTGATRGQAALAAARAAGIRAADEGRLHADPYPSVADVVPGPGGGDAERRLAAVGGPGRAGQPLAAAAATRSARCGTRRSRRGAGPRATAGWHTRHQVIAAVYGHLHIPRTTHYDGVRFEEVSVGYPREWQRRGTAPPPPRVILGG